MSESITVSLLNKHARYLIEHDEVLSQVWVEGEIAGFSVNAKSGHAYFSLRDSAASVRAVMFCEYAGALRFIPRDGMYVVAECRVSLYERDGQFQLMVYNLYPKGAGSIQKQVDELRKKLEREGLFQLARKRPLPRRAARIGVIGSASSAAWQDIISVANRRNPFIQLTLFNAGMQGVTAVDSMLRAMETANRDRSLDVLIIARGGGSREDLWIFNDETLVRAAAGIGVPFISAVGHETDVTLLDLVADARAETPSAAAEMAIYDIIERYQHAAGQFQAGVRRWAGHLEAQGELLKSKKSQLRRAADEGLSLAMERVAQMEALCRALDPKKVLLRGYAHARRGDETIQSIGQLHAGDEFRLELADGAADCRVAEIMGS